jgi:small subunit ribosomal protein S11
MLPKVKIFNTKKVKIKIFVGVFYIYSTYNNTIITITDLKGNTISWSSAGTIGFHGTRKGTPFAAQTAAEAAISTALSLGLHRVEIVVKGKGQGRLPAIRAIRNSCLKVLKVKDITLEPHNGCRSTRKRRI